METAFDVLTSQDEKYLCHVWCDLEKHQMYYRNKCVFDKSKFSNLKGAEYLNKLMLIEEPISSSVEWWSKHLAGLYSAYVSCYPRRFKHSNFVSAKREDVDPLLCRQDFHRCRLRMELFVLFHYYVGDLEWTNEEYFMHKVCEGCVVFRRWLISSR